MKNYSSTKTARGKLAYRTPSRFIYIKCQKTAQNKTVRGRKKIGR